MYSFIGDYTCKADSKWRVVVPASFRKALASSAGSVFVLQKDLFCRCINLYPQEEWSRMLQDVKARLNRFDARHAAFLREFCRGTQEVEMDANGRVLLPRKLLDEAGVGKEMVMAGLDSMIQIWSAEEYEKVAVAPEQLGAMAEEIFKD